MSKIICPYGNVFRVFRNNLEIAPVLDEKFKDKNFKFTAFNNENNTYVFNIPATVHSIKSKQPNFFRKLNIEGNLELNCPCSIDFHVYQKHNPESSYYDFINVKELTINVSQTSNGRANVYLSSEELAHNQDKLTKLTISAPEVIAELKHLWNLKELIIDTKNLSQLKLFCPLLRQLDIRKIKELDVNGNYWNGGWNLFKDHSSYDRNIDKPIVTPQIPGNCIIVLNKNCYFSSTERISSQYPALNNLPVSVDKIQLSSFVNEATAKSYKSIDDTTFSIRYDELKVLCKNLLLNTYKSSLEEISKQLKNEKEIISLMIKDKEKTR